ncbi:MAG: hypothetical protein JJ975_11925 [Bacteroidia bacterium]|nr:hypothetical protein [Bacteroidia bacterium]
MKTIHSKILGELTQDNQFGDWWYSKPIEILWLGCKLKAVFIDFEPDHDKSFIVEADSALDHFLNLEADYKSQTNGLIYDHFREFSSMVGAGYVPDELKGIDKSEIWNFISPTQLLVSRRHRREQAVFINVTCECKWEEEHGLQLVFKKGKALTRVSTQDGHLTTADAYGITDSEDELLAKFEESGL